MPSPYPRDVRHSPRSSAARRQTRSVGKAGSHSSTSDHPRAPSRTDPRFGAPCQRKQPQTALSSSLLLRPSRLAPKRKSLARTARPHCQVRGPLGRHRQAGSPRALRQPRPAGAVGRAKAFSAGAVVDHGPRSRDGCAAGIGIGWYERERGSRQQGAPTWPVGEPRDQPPTCVAAHPLVRRPPPVRHPRRRCQGGRRRVLGLEMATGRDNAARPQCQPVCSTDYRAPRRSGLVRTLLAVAWADSRTGRPLGVM